MYPFTQQLSLNLNCVNHGTEDSGKKETGCCPKSAISSRESALVVEGSAISHLKMSGKPQDVF